MLHAGRAEVFEYNPRNWNSKERKIGGVQNSLLGVAEAIFAEEVGTRAGIAQICRNKLKKSAVIATEDSNECSPPK